MNRSRYLTIFILGAILILVISQLAVQPSKGVIPVVFHFCGTTNDGMGNNLRRFEARNNTPYNLHGQYAVQVFHKGIWFNALPQPKGVDDLTDLPAKSVAYFTVPTPTGRAEQGLLVQSNPPGEKWRTYFSYASSQPPRNVGEDIINRLKKLLGRDEMHAEYAFSPDMSFALTNRPLQVPTK